MKDIKSFDASFFNISPAEAESMDPHQRQLLEVVYEALESGGFASDSIEGSNTGCFIGNFVRDYDELHSADKELATGHLTTGTGLSVLAARISHFFNIKGQSLTLDTACSSGMVALQLACQSLQSGESDMAIVAACNLMFSPDVMMTMSRSRFFSPASQSHAFDSRADGYARGEGTVALILKRQTNAERDADHIRAIVRDIGCNQDGRTPR